MQAIPASLTERGQVRGALDFSLFRRIVTSLRFFSRPSEVLLFAAPCGGTVTGQSGMVASPGYPEQQYQDNLLCEWLLQGPRGHYLTIRLEGLDIQNSSECTRDFVELREHNASGLTTVSVLSPPPRLWNLTRGS